MYDLILLQSGSLLWLVQFIMAIGVDVFKQQFSGLRSHVMLYTMSYYIIVYCMIIYQRVGTLVNSENFLAERYHFCCALALILTHGQTFNATSSGSIVTSK